MSLCIVMKLSITVAHGCGLLNNLTSFCGGMLRINIKSDADSLLYSLSHCECNGHTVHILTQRHLPPPLTSAVKSSLFTLHIPVHSPWLPGYMDVVQNILVILTRVGLPLGASIEDRPCIYLQRSKSFYIHINFIVSCNLYMPAPVLPC